MEKTPAAIEAYATTKRESLAPEALEKDLRFQFGGGRGFTTYEEVKMIPSTEFLSLYPTEDEVIEKSADIEEIEYLAFDIFIQRIKDRAAEVSHTPMYALTLWDKGAEKRVYINGWTPLDIGGEIWIERADLRSGGGRDWILRHKNVGMGAISTSFGRKPWEEVLHCALESRGEDMSLNFDEICALACRK